MSRTHTPSESLEQWVALLADIIVADLLSEWPAPTQPATASAPATRSIGTESASTRSTITRQRRRKGTRSG
jgi:hypothetical protein